MKLLLFHPTVATRDCGHCRLFVYDEQTGKPKLYAGQEVSRQGGAPPCKLNNNCPKGTYDNPIELSDRNRRAYTHYLKCKAVGRFPEDAIVERTAMYCRNLEEHLARSREIEFQKLLAGLMVKRAADG